MHEQLYDEMFRLESRHWWFRGKRKIVLSLLREFLPPGPDPGRAPRVCDIGCGCGMMLEVLKAGGFDAIGVDASEKALEYCRRRGAEVLKGALPDDIPAIAGPVDAVLLLDVLEHVEEDRASFRAAMEIVRPGGVVICTVPAFPFLWTSRDDFHHHKRRYRRGPLRSVLLAHPDSRLVVLSHMNTILFLPAMVERLVRRLMPYKSPSTLTIPPRWINRVLEWCFTVERFRLCVGARLPVGLSLVGVVRRGVN